MGSWFGCPLPLLFCLEIDLSFSSQLDNEVALLVEVG